MRFLVDNAVSPFVSAGLNAEGHDAIHVREIGLSGAPDEEIFTFASNEDRIIISADTDFGALLALRETSKPSFVLFRQMDKRPAKQLHFLLSHLSTLEADLTSGCIVVCEDERIRIRALPIVKA
ncbi:MAG: DUF5615 family PIN-like protein [Bacteroidota bacterium]